MAKKLCGYAVMMTLDTFYDSVKPKKRKNIFLQKNGQRIMSNLILVKAQWSLRLLGDNL